MRQTAATLDGYLRHPDMIAEVCKQFDCTTAEYTGATRHLESLGIYISASSHRFRTADSNVSLYFQVVCPQTKATMGGGGGYPRCGPLCSSPKTERFFFFFLLGVADILEGYTHREIDYSKGLTTSKEYGIAYVASGFESMNKERHKSERTPLWQSWSP